MTQEYAFGTNEFKGCECPARAAGYNPATGGFSRDLAERFDNIIREKVGKDAGTVSEEEASEAWRKMVDNIENEMVVAGNRELEYMIENAKNELMLADEIAEKLGWT